MERKFGAHMSIAGGLDRAVGAAEALGFRSLQIFTKSVNQWAAPPLTESAITAFRSAMSRSTVEIAAVHASYLINIASPDEELRSKSIDALTVEIERCAALGVMDLVLHPGAHMGEGEDAGLRRGAQSLNEAIRRTEGVAVRIDLETTAAQGTCLGGKVEHLGSLLDEVARPERLGICCDTCHLFAAGYPLALRTGYDELMEALERAAGLGRVRIWHLNDSQRALGSRVDRHAAIGQGQMGLDPFRFLVNDPRFVDVPFILETPKGKEGDEDLDAVNLRTLLGLLNPQADRR